MRKLEFENLSDILKVGIIGGVSFVSLLGTLITAVSLIGYFKFIGAL